MAHPCVVCRTEQAVVACEECRRKLAEQLADLPRKYAALGLKLIRGGDGQGDGVGVHASKVEAPDVLNMHALSLLAGGSEQVSVALHPLIRRWSVDETVKVERTVKGKTVVEDRHIRTWFNEPVTGPDGRQVMVPDDDQVGALPPREWLDVTVRAWRSQLGHHVPLRTSGHRLHRPDPDRAFVSVWPAEPTDQPRRYTALRLAPAMMLALLSTQAGRDVYALLTAIELYRQQRVNRFLGLLSGVEPAVDPLAEEIETRFGEPPRSQAMAWDVDYLLTWLDVACDRDLGIADFAADLGALTAELERALGEHVTRTWIGRCPSFLITEIPGADGEVPTVRRKPCGGGLWHEPGWAQVPCSRCHSTYEVRGPSAAYTVREIRRVWPYDRRRRYTSDERRELRGVGLDCPSCGFLLRITWREVTARGDRERTWQPIKAVCDFGHDETRRAM